MLAFAYPECLVQGFVHRSKDNKAEASKRCNRWPK